MNVMNVENHSVRSQNSLHITEHTQGRNPMNVMFAENHSM